WLMTLRARARSIGLSRMVTIPVRPLPRLPRSTNPCACRMRSGVAPRASSGDGGWIRRGRKTERLCNRGMGKVLVKVCQRGVPEQGRGRTEPILTHREFTRKQYFHFQAVVFRPGSRHNVLMSKTRRFRRTYIREWRKHRGLTLEKVADRLDMTPGHISMLE